jgi:hypothetical protein
MSRYVRCLSAAMVAATVGISGVAYAAPRPAQSRERTERRVYDRSHRDYHVWNAAEEQAYRRWLVERRLKSREWRQMNRKHQAEYWRWRHDHP